MDLLERAMVKLIWVIKLHFNISIFQRFNILAFCYVYHFQEKSAYHRFLNNTSAHTHVFRHD